LAGSRLPSIVFPEIPLTFLAKRRPQPRAPFFVSRATGRSRMIDFIEENWIAIVATIVAAIALFLLLAF
jgi:hypothetical protein